MLPRRLVTSPTHPPGPPLRLPPARDIRGIVEGEPAQLIEAVAERVAARVLATQQRVSAVQVAIHKPHVAVGGVVASLGVEVTRTRQQWLEQQRRQQQQEQPDPRLLSPIAAPSPPRAGGG